MTIEAMKQALASLKIHGAPVPDVHDSITTLRTAIEQAEKQEPVAWIYTGIKQDGSTHGPHLVWKLEYMDAMSADKGAKANAIPLYTQSPPAAPVQEPVAGPRMTIDASAPIVMTPHPAFTRQPTAQRQWVGLTDEEISACDPHEECWGLHEAVRRAEAKLRGKNGY